MAVLITGGAGYIGSHMVLDLVEAGEPVVVLDNLSTGFASAVPDGVPLIVGEAGDGGLVKRLIADYRVDAIIHLAAKAVAPASVAAPLSYYECNFSQTTTLLAAAVESGVRSLVFSSTAAVYGQPERNPVAEGDPTTPLTPYGRSKLMVEWMLEDASRAHDLRFVALRYFNVAGADPQGRAGQSTASAANVIKRAVEAALGARPGFEVFGLDYQTQDGSCIRDYIQVTDLARAHRDALRYLRLGGESLVCNCGYGRGYSVLEVVDAVRRVTGAELPVRPAARRPGDAAEVIACSARARETLGWRPQWDDLLSIVRQAVDWERKHLRSQSDGPRQPASLLGAPQDTLYRSRPKLRR